MPTQRTTGRIVVLLVAFSMIVSVGTVGVAAQSDQPDWADSLYQNAQSMVSTYNEQVTADDLGQAAGQLKGEKIDLVVTDRQSGETATFSFRMTEDLKIVELSKGPRDDATLKMTTTRATVERINGANHPGVAFRNAVKSRDIEIHGVTLVNKVKWGVINAVGGALGLFG
ncbi:MAG: hypothetical protein ABEI96_03315 [Haloarculaceae archaeon]